MPILKNNTLKIRIDRFSVFSYLNPAHCCFQLFLLRYALLRRLCIALLELRHLLLIGLPVAFDPIQSLKEQFIFIQLIFLNSDFDCFSDLFLRLSCSCSTRIFDICSASFAVLYILNAFTSSTSWLENKNQIKMSKWKCNCLHIIAKIIFCYHDARTWFASLFSLNPFFI